MAYSYKPHHFEEFAEGQTFETPGRTLTETDVVRHAGITGDWTELHTNSEYAADSAFGERVVHGPLTFSVATGLLMGCGVMERTVIAFTGIEDLSLPRPTHVGNTVSLTAEVTRTREPESREDAGVVTFDCTVENQDDEVVLTFDMTFLVARREG